MASQSAHAVAIFKLPIKEEANCKSVYTETTQTLDSRGTQGEKEKSNLKLLCM